MALIAFLLMSLGIWSTAISPVSATFQPFNSSTLPSNISAACGTALSTTLACNPLAFAFQSGSFYNSQNLSATCNSTCLSSLTSWQANIGKSCAGVTYPDQFGNSQAIQMLPALILYNYNQTCRQLSGQWCNVVLGNAANASAGGNSTACNLCAVQELQFAAGSPYFDGPALRMNSVYQSYTSSCKVSGYPLTTSTIGYSTPSTTSSPASSTTCAGSTYTIKAGDTCTSISKTQGIGTMWLLTDNNLQSGCAGFPTSGTLCLVNTCSVYTVLQTDTCGSIAAGANITITQLMAWNPVINAGCNNLNNSVGYQVCVQQPGPNKYVVPTTSFSPATSVSTTASAPTNVASGTNQRCGLYYQAQPGDYCNLIVLRYGISLSNFLFLNAGVNSNCTNLYAYESYCVEPVGDINTYSGMPGYVTTTPTQSMPAFSSYPSATFVPTVTNNNLSSLPLAPGTRSDCTVYMTGKQLQLAGNNMSACTAVTLYLGVSLTDLGYWNPSLNTSSGSCGFNTSVSYCLLWVDAYDAPIPMPTALPIRAGADPNCTAYIAVEPGLTCQTILTAECLTIAQFYAMNTAIGADCSGLWTGYQYCIRNSSMTNVTCSSTSTVSTISSSSKSSTSSSTSKPSTTTSTSTSKSSSTTSTTGPGAPTQSGEPANCNKWYTAKSGDTCSTVEQAYSITSAQFLAWNPAVSSDCTSGFWAGEAYCVGISSSSTSKSSTTTPTTKPTTTTSSSSKTSTTASVPSPTQSGSISSKCNKYGQAASGATCSTFASSNGITTTQLYTWNTILGSNGANCGTELWAGYWYCTGVSS